MDNGTLAGITLRAVQEQDLPLLLAWRADREVMQYLASAPIVPTWADQWAWWTRSGHRRTWMVEFKDSDAPERPVGEVHVDTETHEVGLVIGEKGAWGKGVGRASLLELMLKMPLLGIALDDLWAAIHPANVRSQHLFASIGFVMKGEPARNGQETWRFQRRTP